MRRRKYLSTELVLALWKTGLLFDPGSIVSIERYPNPNPKTACIRYLMRPVSCKKITWNSLFDSIVSHFRFVVFRSRELDKVVVAPWS